MMKLLLLLYACASAIALLLFGIDKLRAKCRAWRIRESVLLGITLLGGSVGALLGMTLFRHKTRHWYFWAVAILSLALHAWLLSLAKGL